MKISDIVMACGEMLEIDELVNAKMSNGKIELYGDSIKDKEINKMAKCVIYTLERIIQDYFPIKSCVNLTPIDNKVLYKDITTNKILSIFEINSKLGVALEYQLFDKYIKVDTNESVNIVYSYTVGESATYQTELDFLPPMITKRLIAYGSCYEYCVMNARYNESEIFNKKFIDCISSAIKSRGPIHIKPRVWR